MKIETIRNVAIIAHVDHGKTTLVDALFRGAHTFRDNQRIADCAMDSNPIERERGITILAKVTSVKWNGIKINIVDTPGHADFGGQVERTLSLADGCILVVDAFEGPMPQTRFVLRKAFEHNLKPIVVINKIDRPDARPNEVLSEVFDLFVSLEAPDDALDFPTIYASGRGGVATKDPSIPAVDMTPLFETIISHIPAPEADPEGTSVFQASTLDYDDYVGRIAIGRIFRGKFKQNQRVRVMHQGSREYTSGTFHDGTIKSLSWFEGLSKFPAEEVSAGDICSISGLDEVGIGDTFCDPDFPEQLPAITVDEPTISMVFSVNNGPFSGRSGKFITSRQIRERLFKAALQDGALHVSETDSTDAFSAAGRGVMHLGILIENMRREGYEFCVSTPRVIYKEINGKKCEPIEEAVVDCPSDSMGRVIEYLGKRRGELKEMSRKGEFTHLEFTVPSRGLIGARTAILTLTQGNGTIHHNYSKYEPERGDIAGRQFGSLIAHETGQVSAYALEMLSDRGIYFVEPQDQAYEGQIIGQHCHENDLVVNACKAKKLTNIRSAGAEKNVRLQPARKMTLEESLEYIADDELVEVTPEAIRLRKRLLSSSERRRVERSAGVTS
ncbi:MAG: translational GTPase TypA [Planctomycetes bacterium]|nr:translational GTPase TypA [Planctomycetota bacterium]